MTRLQKSLKLLQVLRAVYFVAAAIAVGLPFSGIGSEYLLALSGGFAAAIAGAKVVFATVVIRDLEARKFWAWGGAVALFALSLGSLLLPVGILGLLNLVSREVREEFKVDEQVKAWV